MPIPERTYKEKRDFIRMDIEAEILCKHRSTEEKFKGLCKNLSHTGIQFVTSKSLEKEDVIDVTLKVDSGVFKPLKAMLTVIRVKKQAGEKYLVSGELKELK